MDWNFCYDCRVSSTTQISNLLIFFFSFVSACKLTDKEALAKMGLSIKTVMDTATEAFAAMTFSFGFGSFYSISIASS